MLCKGEHIGRKVTGADLPHEHLCPCGLLSNGWPTSQAENEAPVGVFWSFLLVRQVFPDFLWDALAQDLLMQNSITDGDLLQAASTLDSS